MLVGATVIAILVIVLVIGAAVASIVRDRKKGIKCSGCPMSGDKNCRCGRT